jgi:nitrogen regulatory protein PII
MKRVDLILSERELDAVLKVIDEAGAPGYSVMKHVTGKGPHGRVSDAMDFSGLGANAHVIVFCEAEILPKLREGIQPLLDYYGGVAYVADADPL